MKGRTTCPKCKHEFVLDVPDSCNRYEVVCTKCKNKFTIQTGSSDGVPGEECFWEEHGEPRKTILSSKKRKTNKPMVAAVLLICVFALGLTTSAVSEAFIESSMAALSGIGMKGNVELLVKDDFNNTLEAVNINIDGISGDTDKNGTFSIENATLGFQNVNLVLTDYKTLTQEILVFPFINSYIEIILEEGEGEESNSFETLGCSIILGIFSVFALLGAVVSLKRQNFDVAVAGSFIGIFSCGFFLIGSILSIIAFVLIIRSKEEFKNGKKGKIF